MAGWAEQAVHEGERGLVVLVVLRLLDKCIAFSRNRPPRQECLNRTLTLNGNREFRAYGMLMHDCPPSSATASPRRIPINTNAVANVLHATQGGNPPKAQNVRQRTDCASKLVPNGMHRFGR
jgi:hypothetical protein